VFPSVELGEPGQRAIIAWNGEEEVLILSTDVWAGREAVVVEVLPLPSKPEVEAASSWAFREVQRLLREKAVKAAGLEALKPVRGVEVVLHEEIGVHEVVVVEAHNARELLEWLREYLRERGLNPGFCGVSTGGPCSSDKDCVRSGCSGEVCQSKLEEPVVTPLRVEGVLRCGEVWGEVRLRPGEVHVGGGVAPRPAGGAAGGLREEGLSVLRGRHS